MNSITDADSCPMTNSTYEVCSDLVNDPVPDTDPCITDYIIIINCTVISVSFEVTIKLTGLLL